MKHNMDILEVDELSQNEKPTFWRQVLRIFLILFAVTVGIVCFLIFIAICRTLSLHEAIQTDDYSHLDIWAPEERIRYFTSIFAESLRFKTISKSPRNTDRDEIEKMQQFLFLKFPLVFNSSFIQWEKVNQSSLLIHVQGTDVSLAPYMLASHLDVVPVQEDQWTHDPFLGRIIHDPISQNEVVWGRGAIDDKSGVIGILSAMELLLETGWRARRSFYVAFGHDEEVSGLEGAKSIGELLQQRNVQLDFLIDEGMPVTQGILPGLEVPVALIGVTEKGWMNVKIEATGEGGHSSIPPKNQAVTKLARAIDNLQQYPQPSMFGTGPESDMLTYVAPRAKWPYALLYSNQWLFGSLMSIGFSQDRESNAIIRTTTVVTKVSAGVKDNIVPLKAWALVNHRVHPGQSLKGVLDYDRTAIGNQEIKVEMLAGETPHPVSPYDANSSAFKLIASAIRYVHPTAITAPSIMVANTDSRHYVKLSKQIYRLYPFVLTKQQLVKIHSKDELLSVTSFTNAIKFYQVIIRAVDSDNFTGTLDETYSNIMEPEKDPIFFKE